MYKMAAKKEFRKRKLLSKYQIYLCNKFNMSRANAVFRRKILGKHFDDERGKEQRIQ